MRTHRDPVGSAHWPDTSSLFGRDHELATLRSLVSSVAGGAPAAVQITGPAGVGKTRLAREALAMAGGAGFATFAGHAHDLGGDVAYAPLVEAFGAPLRAMAPARVAALTGDMPQLGLLFSGLGLTPPGPLGDPALERVRLMDALARLTERLARERPLALLVDDVHAADTSTASMLRYLASTMADRPILLVLTARHDEPSRDRAAALGAGLAESAWRVERIVVAPLSESAAADLIGHLLGRPVSADLAKLVVNRCAGRPLFLEAVARTLTESGHLTERDGALRLTGALPLPDGVQAQLRARIAPLPAEERTLLLILAVAGGPIAHDVLLRTARLAQQEAVTALDQLYRKGLVVSAGEATGYDLAHGLLRDTLLAGTSPIALAQRHADIAEALMECHPQDPALPAHVLAAGTLVEPEPALDHLLRGGQHARRLGAVEDAARYLEAACQIARERGRGDTLASALTELGTVRQWMGQPERACAAWNEAEAEYASQGDTIGVARMERELAMRCWEDGELDAARGHLGAAQAALAGLEPSPEHAELLYARMITASRVGDSATVARTASSLRELSAQLGFPTLAARAYLAEAALDYSRTDYVGMSSKSERGLRIATSAGEQALMGRAYDQLSVSAASQGDIASLRRYSTESLRLARKTGAAVNEGWPRIRLAVADLLSGDWDAALRGTTEVSTLATRLVARRGSVSTFGTHAWVLVHLGRLADARSYLQRAHSAAGPMLQADHNVVNLVAIAATALALAEDDPHEAARHGAQLAHLASGWLPLLAAAALGEAMAGSGDADGARSLAARVRDVRSCTTVLPGAVAGWIRGLAAVGEGREHEGTEVLHACAVAFDQLGLPFYAARAQLAAASTVTGRKPAAAIDTARGALRTFDELGAPIQSQQARRLLRSLGVVPSRGRARKRTGSRLSARELEVSRLVATGLSNAEVATRLFISPRTVTTHLDRIYTRLGLSSRMALTRYLADSGLLEVSGYAMDTEPLRE